jgi:predicted GTPase|tara:strand:- start:733 stop:909 length:177 start_codon:yes stop_codon:yes gene_type:complete
MMTDNLRSYIRVILENEYHWDTASKKVMMLDKPGMEDSDKEDQEKYLKSMSLMEALDL